MKTTSHPIRSLLIVTITLGLLSCDGWKDPGNPSGEATARQASAWPGYSGEGGRKYSAADQITPANVAALKPIWTYHTGDISTGRPDYGSTSAFEATPLLVDGMLYLCSPFNKVTALDPATGNETWSFDPKINLKGNYSNQMVCRGVSHWEDADETAGGICSKRIFTSTLDTRLIALDALTGERCQDFGTNGEVDLSSGVGTIRYPGEYSHTSPPAVIADKVIVGGAIGDHGGTQVPSGVVRAYNAVTGKLEWAQDMAPPDYDYEVHGQSAAGYALASPNVWAPMATDEELGLIFAPTGNPSPDYFRTGVPDMDYYGSSLVALDKDTGNIVWHYQFVHNDFWDFDTPAQPSFFTLERDGKQIPALAQATKMGFIFILDRRTGEPLFPVQERPAPQETDVALGLSPTQPWPVLPKPVSGTRLDPKKPFGLTFWDRGKCRKELESLRYDGIFTPPSTDWTLMFTGNAGGINWGGVSIDPERQLLVVNSSNLAWKVRLIPRADFEAVKKANYGHEIGPQRGTDYGVWREMVGSPIGIPCNPTPWGMVTGINLKTGEQLWQSTLGTTRDLAPVPLALKTGTPNLGGPLTTKGGLTFIGAAMDNYIRAFDNETGEEIWKHRLPAPAVAGAMSYTARGPDGQERQYIVIASGGFGRMPVDMSDTLVAFALED